MELQDGFIVGVHNYCDRWCEACPFTSRCQAFAEVATMEASLDPSMKAIVDAPPHPRDVPPEPPAWLVEEVEALNEAANEPLTERDRAYLFPDPPPAHKAIEERAFAYATRCRDWLRAHEEHDSRDPAHPVAVVGWYYMFIAAKIHRAVSGLAWNRDAFDGVSADCDGSAKVALIAIERSLAAWPRLVERGLLRQGEAAPLLADLTWLRDRLDDVFPNARAFVRPGFDEPEEVARLQASDER